MRLFFIFFLSFAVRAETSKPIYLSSQEKALLALSFKIHSLEKEQQKWLWTQLKQSFQSQVLPEKIEVRSFDEFLSQENQVKWFSEHSVADLNVHDLAAMLSRRLYFSQKKSVQAQIQDYYHRKQELRYSVLSYLQSEATQMSGALMNLDIQKIQQQVNEKLQELSEKSLLPLNDLKHSVHAKIIAKLIKGYYRSLPIEQKMELVYRVAQMPYPSGSLDVLLVLIQNSGPQFQKFLQIMGRHDDLPIEIRRLFQKLENSVQEVPWWKVQLLLKSDSSFGEFDYFAEKPIGVGTMAQAHIAGFRGKKVVVRFLKPGVEEKLKIDHQILKKLTQSIDNDEELKPFKLPSLSKVIDDINESVVEELDIDQTIRNQLKAREIYISEMLIAFDQQKNFIHLVVPEAFKVNPKSKLMLQELVSGQKPAREFENFRDIYPNLYRVVAEKISQLWVDRAFFTSGFFHADLHQGNMLAMVTDDAIFVYFLDFGMVGALDNHLRKSALLLAVGTKINHSSLIARQFLSLDKHKRSESFKKEFQKAIEEKIVEIQKQGRRNQSLEEWTAWAINFGLDLNYEFLKLNRGLLAIDTLLMDARSKEDLNSISQKVALNHKISYLKLLLEDQTLELGHYFDIGKEAVKTPERRPRRNNLSQCARIFN